MVTKQEQDIGFRNGRAVYFFRGSPWIELTTGKAFAGPEGDELFDKDLSDKADVIDTWRLGMLANPKYQELSIKSKVV